MTNMENILGKGKLTSVLLVFVLVATSLMIMVPLTAPTVRGQIMHLSDTLSEDGILPYDIDGLLNGIVVWDPTEDHLIAADYIVDPGYTLDIPALDYIVDPSLSSEITFTIIDTKIEVLGTLTTHSDGNPLTKTLFQGGGLAPWRGLYFRPGSSGEITDCIIDGATEGVFLQDASNVDISDNIIRNNVNGIRLSDTSNSVISNNEISNNDFGIYLTSSDGNSILDNGIFYNLRGIFLENSNYNTISGNMISDNSLSGIRLSSSDSNQIVNNPMISYNPNGIYLESGSNLNTISQNPDITDNECGIYVDNSYSNNISWNYIHDNPEYGIYFLSSSGEIYENTIEYCNIGIKLDASPSVIIHDNTINCFVMDIDIDPSGAIIEDNILMNAIYGIKLDNSFALINNNIITGCTYGIYIYYSDPVITNNIFEDNLYAIFIADESYPIINNNTFVNNTYDINFMVWSIDIDPDTLNLKSQGRWITCYLEPSEDVDLNTVDISSIRISEIGGLPVNIPAESRPTAIGDEDGDGIPDLMVKFDRSEVEDAAWPGDLEITVEGELLDGTPFVGYCTIGVIEPGK